MRIVCDTSLLVALEGWEAAAALRRKLTVERDSITALRFHGSYQDPGGALRVGGTGLPRVVYAGHFRRQGQREFWYVRKPRGFSRFRAENVLEIETTGRFARVLLTTTPAEADSVIRWFDRTSARL